MENARKRPTRIIIAITIAILMVGISIFMILVINPMISGGKVMIIENKSYFSDFTVKNNDVFLYYQIAFKNTYSNKVKIKITARMNDDVKIGLLKLAELEGKNKENNLNYFELKANSTTVFDVEFTGEFGGVNKQTNKLLPDITIQIINENNSSGQNWQTVNGFRIEKEPIINRFPLLNDFRKCYWKADIIGNNERITVPGPSSYWMKGFVFLYSKEIEKYKTQYKWTDCEENWKPSLDTEILNTEDLNWSYSEDFNNYIKYSNYVGEFYFDIKNGILFFDIQK